MYDYDGNGDVSHHEFLSLLKDGLGLAINGEEAGLLCRRLDKDNDGTIYEGTASIVDSKLQISGISTTLFNETDKVKIFGVTNTSIGSTVPLAANTMVAAPIPTTGGSTVRTYYYWVSEYNLSTGQVGAAVSTVTSIVPG